MAIVLLARLVILIPFGLGFTLHVPLVPLVGRL
jgi:hypothetical protein